MFNSVTFVIIANTILKLGRYYYRTLHFILLIPNCLPVELNLFTFQPIHNMPSIAFQWIRSIFY